MEAGIMENSIVSVAMEKEFFMTKKKGLSIAVNGSIIRKRVMESLNGKTVINIKEILKII
jgi:hypothetical protein